MGVQPGHGPVGGVGRGARCPWRGGDRGGGDGRIPLDDVEHDAGDAWVVEPVDLEEAGSPCSGRSPGGLRQIWTAATVDGKR